MIFFILLLFCFPLFPIEHESSAEEEHHHHLAHLI